MAAETVLGIWDGHDAGAALLRGGEVLFAVNEERLSRRKLEVGFPRLSIAACLKFAGLDPSQIRTVAASTTDPAKTLTRLFPSLKEEYYLIRRRRKPPRRLDPLRKAFKYRFTELGPNILSRALSRSRILSLLEKDGFRDFQLDLVDHHSAHAASAAYCSGFPEALVLTLDGVGDGLSGSAWRLRDGSLELLKAYPANTSLGIFFEHVTNLMNMRELEDEGKVMALANYAYPVPDEENPLMGIVTAEADALVSPYTSTAMFRELKRILWRYPSEQFAYMAQRALEHCALGLVRSLAERTGARRIAAAGGVFSNIKMNMAIAALPGIERIYVFPHMGDGGLALGAAMESNRRRNAVSSYTLGDLYLGPSFSREEIQAALEKNGAATPTPSPVVLANAGTQRPDYAQGAADKDPRHWIPASAGMTEEKTGITEKGLDSRLRGNDTLRQAQGGRGGNDKEKSENDKVDEPSVASVSSFATPTPSPVVFANAGTQCPDYAPAEANPRTLDSRLRGNDRKEGSPLRVSRPDDLPATAARAILDGQIVLWFTGRLEIGPRALGGRSILARPDRRDVKDRLNVLLKKRVWYQPFCPSMLIEDAPELLHTEGQDICDNRFMTMAFRVRHDRLPLMEGVVNIDGTCRPHFVAAENPPYRKLLERIKAETGFGVVLNTSFNIHGEPMVCSPAEALFMLRGTGIRYLFLEDLLVENLAAKD
ncbi:MAG TPA: carbamoyltransferase C-terminal domain-containing protein [Syntrophales bacterium]|nr:carbamoyltransferase C-terminal domain-containing protein [Syntrophales bacterium]